MRREKFRRLRKLGVREINEPAARFGYEGLIDGIQRVRYAARVVFTDSQVRM